MLKRRNDLERALMDRYDYAMNLDLVDDDWYHRAIIRMSRYSDEDLVQAVVVAERAVWNHALGYSSNRALKRSLNYSNVAGYCDPLDHAKNDYAPLRGDASEVWAQWTDENHEALADPDDFTWDKF